ncbi:peptidoglycan editing factor PgeF [Roseibacterium sp. SDUM158016]|uniref:peptidoglycan editing factor PgeF n=1 Tax=Roseicyclus sediminis TaxID=2980997 RepID=UPI0021D2EAD2|nr:peptidoglycan editing factor PgeF [Roseibacterium sp. SDUM158016]MCU4653627.1 peptidoglycan editing factor PgeF [Roseibacterium sp. SDUM158016]
MTAVTVSLEILTSPVLDGVRHGFFSRRGGASSGIFEGLNCGGGSSDQAEIVAMNRDRAARALDVPPTHLVTVNQVHSATAVTLDAPPADRPRADAIVSTTPGLAIAVLTADCQPVLFADAEAGVIAAAHAGWRGALDGILEATIEEMEAQGARRENIRAAIGPSISQAAYEVGQEFLERFCDDDPENARFFINGASGKYLFDLPGYGLKRLRDAEIAGAEWTRHCTYRDANRFYSYRRATHRGEADYGRLLSAIRL